MATVPSVLLLHGFAASCARTWREPGWFDLLADAGRSVIGVDLLGHGDAPKPHDPAAYDDLEGRVLAELPDEPVDAIGFSLGSRVLLTLAADHPERFRRLVVAGVGANLFRADDPERIARALEGAGAPRAGEYEGGDDDEADVVAGYFVRMATASGNDPQALAALLRRRVPALGSAELARVTHPVLVVLGDRDFAGPADPLVEALPDARLVIRRGLDHFATPKDFGFIDSALDFLG